MKRICGVVVATVAALLLAGPVQAQDPPISSGIFTLNPDGSLGNTGLFDVMIQQDYNTNTSLYTDTITITNDASSLPNDAGVNGATELEVQLYTGYNEAGSLDSTVDGTPTNTDGGTAEPLSGATYFISESFIPLDQLNTDRFQMQTNEQIDSARLYIGDGTSTSQPSGGIWSGQGNLTPEPAALALLLPGLLPVGLVLRRRRRAPNG